MHLIFGDAVCKPVWTNGDSRWPNNDSCVFILSLNFLMTLFTILRLQTQLRFVHVVVWSWSDSIYVLLMHRWIIYLSGRSQLENTLLLYKATCHRTAISKVSFQILCSRWWTECKRNNKIVKPTNYQININVCDFHVFHRTNIKSKISVCILKWGTLMNLAEVHMFKLIILLKYFCRSVPDFS